MPLEHLTANTKPAGVRREVLEGKTHVVVPMVMLVSGVVPGSNGPLLYTPSEMKKGPEGWNNKPVVVYHPQRNGKPSTAADPVVLNTQKVGIVLNNRYAEKDGKARWKAEAWINEELGKRYMPDVMQKIQQGEKVEVSTGVYTENEERKGTHDGKEYVAVAKNYVPDHLAILPEGKGACSVKDGAGLLQNSLYSEGDLSPEDEYDFTGNRDFSESERKKMAKSGQAESDGSYPIKNKQDLHNAIQAYGRSKNKAKTKAHIVARAKALGLTSMLPSGWTTTENAAVSLACPDCGKDLDCPHCSGRSGKMAKNSLAANAMSHSRVHSNLQDKLNDKYGPYRAHVQDVYPGFVVYGRRTEEGQTKLYKHDYKVDKRKGASDQVSLSGDPDPVERVTEYRTPDGLFVGNALHNGSFPSTPSTETEMDDKAKATVVTQIIANSNGQLDEADREWLMKKTPEWLKLLPGGTQVATKDTSPTPAPVANAAPAPTFQELLAKAPAEWQEAIQEGMHAANAERTRLTAAITANARNKFTAEQLGAMRLPDLRNLAELATPVVAEPILPKAPPVANWAGAAGAFPPVAAGVTPPTLGLPASTKPETVSK